MNMHMTLKRLSVFSLFGMIVMVMSVAILANDGKADDQPNLPETQVDAVADYLEKNLETARQDFIDTPAMMEEWKYSESRQRETLSFKELLIYQRQATLYSWKLANASDHERRRHWADQIISNNELRLPLLEKAKEAAMEERSERYVENYVKGINQIRYENRLLQTLFYRESPDERPTAADIADLIVETMKKSIEKAEKIHDDCLGFYKVSSSQHPRASYEINLAKSHVCESQLAMYRWQYRNAENDEARDDIARKIMATYVDQIDTAKNVASEAEQCRKWGVITPQDCLDAEIALDRAVWERLNFPPTNQSDESRNAQILELLENNAKKAERMVEEHQYIGTPPRVILATPFARLFAEFYLHQKQIELLRWQYQNTEDGESCQKTAENLVATYEKQWDTTQKLVVMSKELFQQYKATILTCLHCENLHDRIAFDREIFKLTIRTEDNGDISGQTARILQDQRDKAQQILKNYIKEFQEDSETQRRPARTNVLGLLQTKYFFLQKQVEYHRWHYENAKDHDSRREYAKKLLDVYETQWATANYLAETAREYKDIGILTMKDFLECEAVFDQTTVDMLEFLR